MTKILRKAAKTMRRTISNLSRELHVSRPCIYRAIERLQIPQKAGDEYPLNEWEMLKMELARTSDNNKQKRADAKVVSKAGVSGAKKAARVINNQVKIHDVEVSTLRERLNHVKQEYDYNRSLIIMFQGETQEYYEREGRTTMQSHNGTMTSIPSITNLEKYVKLNVIVSKLITDLENDLDLEVDGGDDPFG